MGKAPTPDTIAAELTVPERVLLFCLASGTDWVKAGVTHATAQHLLVRNLVDRDQSTDFELTDQGCAVLAALAEVIAGDGKLFTRTGLDIGRGNGPRGSRGPWGSRG
jgi:hypothetical protein